VKKRRQHYVWQHYLKAWTKRGRIACLRDGRIFRTNTSNIAVEANFYRLKELTTSDIQFIEEQWIKTCAPELRSVQQGWIFLFKAIFDLKRCSEAFGRLRPKVDHRIDMAINNLEEEFHSRIESESVPQLEALRKGDLDFLASDDEFVGFLHFLCLQYLRTANIRAKVLEAVGSIPRFDVARAWGVMRHVFATSICYRMFMERDLLKITVMEAGEGSEFITSDQPVINMHAVGLPLGAAVDELELYYPVSPTVGLVLEAHHPVGGKHRRTLNPIEAAKYNDAIFRLAHTQVFASDEKLLRSIHEAKSATSADARNTVRG
jgi:hypothetical protein